MGFKHGKPKFASVVAEALKDYSTKTDRDRQQNAWLELLGFKQPETDTQKIVAGVGRMLRLYDQYSHRLDRKSK